MSQSAYIRFVQGSAAPQMTVEDIQRVLLQYREQTAKTGEQLGWNYAEAAFPYTMEPGRDERWFYLKGTNVLYKHILFGVGQRTDKSGDSTHHVQITLPQEATHGDKAKANELCKYIAKTMLAELVMFNGRTMYYNPRK